MKTVLVTGGTGYIGSHTVVQLIEANIEVVIVDNLSNSCIKVLDRIEAITQKRPHFYQVDICDKQALREVFQKHTFDSVIHFAGLKAVGESSEIPLKYYQTNVSGTMILCEVMSEFDCKKIVFSSSATVYGDPASVPIKENFPVSATNPYGRSKLFVEEILKDLAQSDNEWRIVLLRYFNPIGAHESGRIGEDPKGKPNNLLPFITQVAIGRREKLSIFGDDYPTPDGTGIRDYIHVVDLSRAHVLATQKIDALKTVEIINLGTGSGYSVKEMVSQFEIVSGAKVDCEIVSRRLGDIAECWADAAYAYERLSWKAELHLSKMLEDAWRWQSDNPNGYE